MTTTPSSLIGTDAPSFPAIAVPAGAPRWITPELLADTLHVWQPYYGTLTPQDGLSIILNVSNLFDVLRRSKP